MRLTGSARRWRPWRQRLTAGLGPHHLRLRLLLLRQDFRQLNQPICFGYLSWGTAPAWSLHCSPVAVARRLLLAAAERGRRRGGGGRPPAGRGQGVSSPSECGRRSRRGPGSPTCAPTPSRGEGLPRATAAAARLERGVDGGRTPGCLAPPRSLQSPPSW